MSKKTDRIHKEFGDKALTAIYVDGNFTVCLLNHPKAKGGVVGIAKRNPNSDEFSSELGQAIATERAFINLDKHVHPRRYAWHTK